MRVIRRRNYIFLLFLISTTRQATSFHLGYEIGRTKHSVVPRRIGSRQRLFLLSV